MSGYKNLNSETTRTLKKTLGIPVKLCALINRYKRRHGCFQHMEELWRIPGMTRRYYDMIGKKYTISGQKTPLSVELEPFAWSSLVRPGDSDGKSGTDTRSFPSLRAGWRRARNKSPKPGTSGIKNTNYVLDSVHMAASYTSDQPAQSLVAVNMKKSPARNSNKMSKVVPSTPTGVARKQEFVAFPAQSTTQEDLGDQRRLLVPINVQQSPSGDRLCIIYDCSPQKSPSPAKVQKSVLNENKAQPNSPCTTRSKSPSILKKAIVDKPAKSKSQLEEPRDSPDRHVGFNVTEPLEIPSSTSYKSIHSQTKQIGTTKRVYEEKEEVQEETFLAPTTSRQAGEAGAEACGEKVRKWINSNSDFMKVPGVTEPVWRPSGASEDTRLPEEEIRTQKTMTREWVASGKDGSPRRHTRGREIVVQQRRAPPGIEPSRYDRRSSSSRASSRSSSPPKARRDGRLASNKDRAKIFSRDPQTYGEPSRGYRFHKKRFRRQKSVEKTIRKYKRKEKEENPEEESSSSCALL